jgi:hypothetical protein
MKPVISDQSTVNDSKKSWKERKAEEAAAIKRLLKRVFIIKPEFLVPGSEFASSDGVKYRIAKDGSRRRINQ